MTRKELKRERAMEKARARIVKAEILKSKRTDEIKTHILDIMTAILFFLLIGIAFTVDAFGYVEIPIWIYMAGLIYLFVYLMLVLWKMGKEKK